MAALSAERGPDDPPPLSRHHQRRLRSYYRSAGWPCLDNIEIDLLAAGLIERIANAGAPDTIRVTEEGLQAIAVTIDGNRKAFGAHEALVLAVAQRMCAEGRLAFRGLALRGNCGGTWRSCRPDVYSLRNTTVLTYTRPVIHEIKVRRADLLGDLADESKRAAYQALSSEFYYVMPAGLATLDEIPFDCGVLYAGNAGITLARPAEYRPVHPSLADWMAIARRGAEHFESEAQLQLG